MGQEIQVVVFNAQQEKYAMDITMVGRIIEFITPTLLPEASDYVLGVITYQENILPIIDLNMRLYRQRTECKKDSKILVIQWGNHQIGLLVDQVSEIKAIDQDIIEPPPVIINGISQRYIKGLIKEQDEIIIYLEAEKIFSGVQEEELKEIIIQS